MRQELRACYWGLYEEDGDAVEVLVCSPPSPLPHLQSTNIMFPKPLLRYQEGRLLLITSCLVWDRTESQAAFASVPENLEHIHGVIGPHITVASQMHEIFFNPSALVNLLEGGVVQMITVYGVSAVESIVKALRECRSCKGFDIGDVVQEIKLDDADQAGIAVVMAVGWKGPVSDEDKVKPGAQWWSNEAAKLKPGAKVEVHNVNFKKVSEKREIVG